MKRLNLKTLLLTIITLLGLTGFSFLFWKYQLETLYTIIGIIILMFIRHTYVTIDYLIKK